RRVALAERHVAKAPSRCARPRRRERGFGSADSDDLSGIPNQFRREEGDVARATANIEHPHARHEPRLSKEPSRDRVDDSRLIGQPIDFALGMPKDIPVGGARTLNRLCHTATLSLITGLSLLPNVYRFIPQSLEAIKSRRFWREGKPAFLTMELISMTASLG